MRKQTKLVAVLSAAALLAIGASMTSFAAGWQKSDDGTWQYYDKDDEMVTGAWQKDGAKWFYLDDDGNMTTDSWVEDEYYVGTDGAMLINTWKKTLASDDVTDPDEDGENWYYFGSKGKKVVDTDKKIGGKTYYFEENGKMRDGWYQADSDKVYYLGGEDEGARISGWLWLEMPDDDVNVNGHAEDCTVCDEEGWYYFGSDGKMYKGADKKKINGKYYFFNKHGQMLYEWINGASINRGSNAELDGSHKGATPSNMLYANVVEEGWRADGWYQISGASDTGASDDTNWYYFKDGKAKMAAPKYENDTDATLAKYKYREKIKIAGKYFCFNEVGQMQTGLQRCNGGFYYFDANGYMKTGKINEVEEDNDNFTYYFNTKNGNNGRGVTGEKSGYLYWNGKRMDADDDTRIYEFDLDGNPATANDYYLVNKSGKLQKADKKYKVENENGEEMTFKFGSNYRITEAHYADGTKYDFTSNPDIPVIDLYEENYTN